MKSALEPKRDTVGLAMLMADCRERVLFCQPTRVLVRIHLIIDMILADRPCAMGD